MTTQISLNLQSRLLSIDEETVLLDNSLRDARIDVNSNPKSLDLEYEPTPNEDNSPVYRDLDNLEGALGAEFLSQINACGSFLPDAHYLTFSGDIQATIYNGGLRRCTMLGGVEE